MGDAVPPSDVVRTTRIELVDEAGRVRAVLGRLDTSEPGTPAFGLALLDEAGCQRAWLTLERDGPVLAFDLAGNCVLTLGVDDPIDEDFRVGAYLHMADRSGNTVLGWHVEEDGVVLARFGGSTR